jgi:hypothetical protein
MRQHLRAEVYVNQSRVRSRQPRNVDRHVRHKDRHGYSEWSRHHKDMRKRCARRKAWWSTTGLVISGPAFKSRTLATSRRRK